MNRRDFLARGVLVTGGLWTIGRAPAWGQAAPAAVGGSAPAAAPALRELRRGVSLFTGRGGTIGTLVSQQAVIVVDTQFPDTIATCLDAVRAQAGREADLVINTHHHGDHTGGNGVARERGIRRIVAHENVPRLMREWAAARNPPATVSVPNETFSARWTLDAGDEVIRAEHFGPAHTGGDIIIHFEKANVVHMGDLVFNRLHPVIDRPAGAKIANWIRVLESATERYPSDAIFIFGHGRDEVTGARGDLLVMRDYLAKLLEIVGADIKAGRSLDQVKQRTAIDGCEDYGGGNRLARDLETAFHELTEG